MKQGRQASPSKQKASHLLKLRVWPLACRWPPGVWAVGLHDEISGNWRGIGINKLPWKLTCPLKHDGWNTIFPLKWSLFGGHVNFRWMWYNGTLEVLAEQFQVTDFTNYMESIGLPCFSRTRPCASHQLHLKGSKINCKLRSQAIPSWETNVSFTW